MAENALYKIYASKCFSLAHTMVIHSSLIAKSQNTILEQNGFKVNHNNPSTWKYYLNLAGEYHEYDKLMIAKINGDGHPYMRIKIAGDNKPITVDFNRTLVSGDTGDYALAAEYSYGSDYYNELVAKYPGFESLILGILNPIDIDISQESEDGAILYCGGYYRKRLATLKELYGFEKREDVKIDAEFLIEDWEEDVIYELQDYIKQYLKRWMIPDFQANHTYFSAMIMGGLISGLVVQIHKCRIANCMTYSAHSYHVREYINSFGYLGENVDALTREQAMYLYHNMDWLASNKGKDKVLMELVDNLLTPSGIPLLAYNVTHDNWDMQANQFIYPTIEFKKDYLNFDPKTNDTGTSTLEIVRKEETLARDNGLYVTEQVNEIDSNSQHSGFNELKTKVLESDFTETDSSIFFNLEEFQFYQWLYAVSRGTYKGSVFVSHPITGGRLQLTPLTAMILLIYAYTKGYYGYTLKNVPPMVVRLIPKNANIPQENSSRYPTNEDLWENVLSTQTTQAKIDRIANFSQPSHTYTSITDFYQKTTDMFEIMETRRSYAEAEGDIYANAELELIVAKFYHKLVEIPPLTDLDYNIWLNTIGLDESKLTDLNLRTLADDLMRAGIGVSDTVEKSTERMHESIMNILNFFLSYTVQLVSKFTKTSSRMYGLKTLRMSVDREDYVGKAYVDLGVLTFVHCEGYTQSEWMYLLNNPMFLEPEQEVIGVSMFPLIDMVAEQSQDISHEVFMDITGFTGMVEDPLNPGEPYDDPDKIENIMQISTEVLSDIHESDGQTVAMSLTNEGIGFLNTYGLAEVKQEDFDFIINIEI